jgi:hypothetical protein
MTGNTGPPPSSAKKDFVAYHCNRSDAATEAHGSSADRGSTVLWPRECTRPISPPTHGRSETCALPNRIAQSSSRPPTIHNAAPPAISVKSPSLTNAERRTDGAKMPVLAPISTPAAPVGRATGPRPPRMPTKRTVDTSTERDAAGAGAGRGATDGKDVGTFGGISGSMRPPRSITKPAKKATARATSAHVFP